MSDNPFASPTSPEESFSQEGMSQADLLEPIQPLAMATTWSKILAATLVLLGIMMALTISGIILAWLPIWAGVVLWQHANRMDDAQRTQSPRVLRMAMEKLATAIKVATVFLAIMFAISALYFLVVIGVIIWSITQSNQF